MCNTQMTTTTSLSPYIAGFAALPVPTVEEERDLARRARLGREALERLRSGPPSQGDLDLIDDGRKAHEDLLSRNLRLVISVAKRYPVSARIDFADLVQEGALALDHAIGKFDERLGFKLSTYAVKWIRQALSRLLDKQSSVAKMPIETARQVRVAMRDLAGDRAALPPQLFEASQAWLGTSLDSYAFDDDGKNALVDFASAAAIASFEEESVERLWSRDVISSLLQDLDPLSSHIVIRRFGLDQSPPGSISSIATDLNIGPNRVRSILRTALSSVDANGAGEGVGD